jgi:hypothetical protein
LVACSRGVDGSGRLGCGVEFWILGPVEVWDGAHRLEVGGPKPRTLLAALLVHANRVVATDRLIDELWGETPPPTARNVLQCCLERSLTTSRDLGYRPREAMALHSLGLLLAAKGDPTAARSAWRAALAIFRELGMPEPLEVAARLDHRSS